MAASLTSTTDSAPAPPRPTWGGIAPAWHTVVVLALLGGTSLLTALSSHTTHASNHLLNYIVTMIWEGVLLLFVWWGIRQAKLTMREVIGGRWARPEDFLLDVAIAIGFIFVAYFVIAGIVIGLGGNPQHQLGEARRIANFIAPRTTVELMVAFALSAVAGFVEEVLFRGYLQRQFSGWLKSAWGGVLASGVLFGLSHGYEGVARMVAIAVFGSMFGVLAHFRKSLRPGMIAHAIFDAAQLALLYALSRGMISVPSLLR